MVLVVRKKHAKHKRAVIPANQAPVQAPLHTPGMEFVVARYNESIEWIQRLRNVKLYTKGQPIANPSLVEHLPNVGREGHTFAHYIVTRYDSLPPFVAFLQGNPFDHCPHLFRLINEYVINQRSNMAFLAVRASTTSIDGCPSHAGLPLRDVYSRLFKEVPTFKNYRCGFGAQSIVPRSAILRHPKEFYVKIRDMLAYSNNPIEGFVIERFWGLIFAREDVIIN